LSVCTMLTDSKAVPKNIKLIGGNDALTVQWSDVHSSAYPYSYLRYKCPCATCGGAGLPKQAASPFPMFGVKPLKPERAELVGRYALQIHWNDQHSSGIYSFDYLRQICPCPECAVNREHTASADGS
jgi:DUF971 family protein